MFVELKKDLQVIARGKGSVITSIIDSKNVLVRVSSTGETVAVGVDEIEFLIVADQQNIAWSATGGYEVSDDEFYEAKRRHDILVKFKNGEISQKQAAVEVGVSVNHIYKILGNFDAARGPITLTRRNRGVKKGEVRLNPKIEKVISEAIDVYKNKEAVPISNIWKRVEVVCKEKGYKTPSKATVRQRVYSKLTSLQVTSLRKGKEAAKQKHHAKPGSQALSFPLESAQMDHTLGDVVLLANDRIHPIGRPWITLVVDRYTRVVLGYYLSLHVPNSVSVASALTHAVLPKWEFLGRLGLDKFSYPFFGVPQLLGMDNAKEFKKRRFLLDLDKVQMGYEHRPPGRKHYGGHVERMIGTFMGKLHLLSGTTMSNTVARKNLKSSALPTMTFSEFCRWFALQVYEYHNTVHSALGKSPAEAWTEYFDPTGITPYPPFTTDPQQFRLNFMPTEERVVQTKGIEFKNMFYWDNVLSPLVGTGKAIIKYDPLSMKQIWVKFPTGYVPIPFADMSNPDYTYEEYRAAAFHSGRKIPGAFTTPEGPVAYREAEAIEIKSVKETKRARRQAAAREEYEKEFYPSKTTAEPKDVPDYSQPPKKFGVSDEL
ncbi:Mu transposase C-terminal domain-containing protein [Pseudomonas sp. ADAK13]|uniref:Mu transposase C-terminal domain-containing protein n=1 Tax=Pseudomonas sp. ADAK13 TaxID=2730847 RepID=UPI0014641B0F|nr:Mu transposase C-terminal domain-containing protein [Pseudomonas sp. ADAK13]QJI37902.1 transposase [Pseudomonas sp. ADAK13]